MGISEAEKLADGAISDTITPDILLGNVTYYPEIISHLYDGEQPHYAALLTVNADLVVSVGPQSGTLRSDNAVLVASDQYVRLIFESSHVIEPYETLSEIIITDDPPTRTFQLYCGNRGQVWSHIEAKTADDWIFEDTIQFIQEMIGLNDPIDHSSVSELQELEQKHRNGKISDAEYVQQKNALSNEN